jgi:uncharacterized repeat protein (TIGR01451 family)
LGIALRRAVGVLSILIVATLGFSSASASAATTLRTFIADRSGTACASIDALGNQGSVSTGVAFDGSRLLLSCWTDNKVVAVSATDGSQLAAYAISGGGGFGALAWDPGRSLLWACNQHANEIGTIDLGARTYTKRFVSRGCTDALDYDASDDTLWTGGDERTSVEHYAVSGKLLASYPTGAIGGKAGVSATPFELYVVHPASTGSTIYATTKTLTGPTVFATTARKIEDLDCDGSTFAGKTALWAQNNRDNVMTAYEISSLEGGCGAADTAAANVAVSQSVQPTSVVADDTATFTVTVVNWGPATADGVSLTATLPASAMLVSTTTSRGTCSGARTVSCELGSLAVFEKLTVTIVIRPLAPGTATNKATVTADETDGSPADNLFSKNVKVTPAPATAYVSVTDDGFKPTGLVLSGQGYTAQWNFIGSVPHSATDGTGLNLFDSTLLAPVAYYQFAFTAAGAYAVKDAATLNTQTIRVPVAAPATGTGGTPFPVTWATALPDGLVEDIQVQYPGSTIWSSWLKAQTATSASFTPLQGAGTYRFRAHLRDPVSGKATAFSPAKAVSVS